MKIRYRPEIDGLRAVAVISVILYHAKLNLLGSEIFRGGIQSITKGQIVGKVTVKIKKREVAMLSLTTKKSVQKTSLLRRILNF